MLPVISLTYLVLLLVVFLVKPKINTKENQIFKKLTLFNVAGLFLEILCHTAVQIANDYYFLSVLILKSYLIYTIIWTMIFNVYVFLVSSWRYEEKDESLDKYYSKLKKRSIFIIVIVSIVILVLPIRIFDENGIVYSYGPSVDFLLLSSFLVGFTWLIKFFQNIKTIKQKKYIPIIFCIIILSFVATIQTIDRSILIATTGHAFICFLMYFTIENPDLKLVHEMELAKEAAIKANMAKSDFLSSISHEIRTPLNAIVGLSEINKEAESLEEAKENLEDIINAANILDDIVGNVLDMSKIEGGHLKLNNACYNPKEMFTSVINVIEHRFKEKNLPLNLYIAQDLPNLLFGDYSNFKKVILNLLSNSVKYTKEGYVSFTVNCVNKDVLCRVIISVVDTGRGIKPEKIDKLFNKFDRLEQDKNTTTEGTGLGLAITKHIIELMGGNITVQSVFGSGSKFTVTVDQQIRDNCEETKEEVIEQKESLYFTDKKVLIIDDNNLNLKVAHKLLDRYNCEVEEASSGDECLNIINRGGKFDLLLMDEMMPGMSGSEVMKILKDNGYSVPIVVLTADVDIDARGKYLKKGYDDYLAKPIRIKELENVLKKYLL